MRTHTLAASAATFLVLAGTASAQMLVHTGSHGGGRSIVGLGDLNGDGFADFVVPVATGVRALSGVDRSLIWHMTLGAPYEAINYTLANAGDVDADGTKDLAVGNEYGIQGATQPGWVCIYSGATRALLYQWFGTVDRLGFGAVVDSAGDVDADGFGDVIVGTTRLHAPFPQPQSYAHVYSGHTGALLRAFPSVLAEDSFGRLVTRAGDVNGDGLDDVLIGAPGDGTYAVPPGHLYVYSVINGALLSDITNTPSPINVGLLACTAGDVDQDGFDDIAISAPFENFSTTRPCPSGE